MFVGSNEMELKSPSNVFPFQILPQLERGGEEGASAVRRSAEEGGAGQGAGQAAADRAAAAAATTLSGGECFACTEHFNVGLFFRGISTV